MLTPRERAERALRHAPFLGLGKEAALPFVEQEIIEAQGEERERCIALILVNCNHCRGKGTVRLMNQESGEIVDRECYRCTPAITAIRQESQCPTD